MPPLLLAALLLQVPLDTTTTPVVPLGTYEYVFCRSDCDLQDSTRLVARGTLVIAPDTIDMMFQRDGRFGCYVQAIDRHHESYLTILTKGYFAWRYEDTTATLEFDMYHSPDAWGRVHATMTDTGFIGRGESGGAGVAAIADSKEFVVARRIGPPDTGLCPRSTFEPLDRRAKPFPLAILGALWIGSLLYVKTR